MTPQEALKILTDATATLNINRQSHIAIITALQAIDDLIRRAVDDLIRKAEDPNHQKTLDLKTGNIPASPNSLTKNQ